MALSLPAALLALLGVFLFFLGIGVQAGWLDMAQVDGFSAIALIFLAIVVWILAGAADHYADDYSTTVRRR